MYPTQQLIADTFDTWTKSSTHSTRRAAEDYRMIKRARRWCALPTR